MRKGARSKTKKSQKVGTFFIIDDFVGLFFNNQWGLYDDDLNGFYQSFIKVILKSGPPRTADQFSQKVPGLARIRYAHSAAVPQSYPASIGSGKGDLKCKALIEGGRHVGGVLVGLHSCWEDSIGIC